MRLGREQDAYKISDVDSGGAIEYYGYVDTNGSWYISQLTTTSVRYCRGHNEYESNWDNRIHLVYKLYSSVF